MLLLLKYQDFFIISSCILLAWEQTWERKAKVVFLFSTITHSVINNANIFSAEKTTIKKILHHTTQRSDTDIQNFIMSFKMKQVQRSFRGYKFGYLLVTKNATHRFLSDQHHQVKLTGNALEAEENSVGICSIGCLLSIIIYICNYSIYKLLKFSQQKQLILD